MPSRGVKPAMFRVLRSYCNFGNLRYSEEVPVEQPLDLDADNELIERLAVQLGEAGLGRLEGRICAAMALHDEPRITMGELVDRLGANKSHVSTALRRLVELEWVARVPVF